MAQSLSKKLDAGETFPELALSLIDGKAIKVPGGMRGKWGVVLLYRGDW
jgi:peroxiredoxin